MSDENDVAELEHIGEKFKKKIEENCNNLQSNMRKKYSYEYHLNRLHYDDDDRNHMAFEGRLKILAFSYPSQMTSSTQVPDPANCWVDRIHMNYIMFPYSVPILMKLLYSTFKIIDFLAMWYFYFPNDDNSSEYTDRNTHIGTNRDTWSSPLTRRDSAKYTNSDPPMSSRLRAITDEFNNINTWQRNHKYW